MKVLIVLADAVNEADGKLNLLGAGWNVTDGTLAGAGLALWFTPDPEELAAHHEWRVQLLHDDGSAVVLRTPTGEEQEVDAVGEFSVEAPAHDGEALEVDVPVALNLGPLELPAGCYAWRVTIDGRSEADWQRRFMVTS